MGSKISADEVASRWGRDAKYYENEHPQHEVTITEPFYMGVYEVTQAQWLAVMENNPSEYSVCDGCPVDRVSWNDAQEFISKLNALENTDKYRLPTEAEWEYAARGGTTTIWYWDDDPSMACSYANVADQAWFEKNPNLIVHDCTDGFWWSAPVGQFSPNAFGLFDMTGNVWEWCSDWYDENYYGQSSANDPKGPDSGANRVNRGGGCYNTPNYTRSAVRGYNSPGGRNNNFGFRVARTN